MIMKSDTKYFNHAKNIAEMSDFKRDKTGCVIVYHKSILSVGFNTNKTHTIQARYNKLRFDDEKGIHKTHAEMSALINIRYEDIQWDKVDIYVYRICNGKENGYGLARPCKSCMAYIKELGIKNIYYTTDYGYAYEKLEY